MRACFMLARVILSLSLSLSLGLLYACKGAHTLFTGQREREREREGREIKRERERELSLFLKGMMGALASFSYEVVL